MDKIISNLNDLNTNEKLIISELTSILSIINKNKETSYDSYIQVTNEIFNKIDKNILFSKLNSDNLTIRILSLKIILLLLSMNKSNQKELLYYFNFFPIGSLICLNWFPSQLKQILNNEDNLMVYLMNDLNNNKSWLNTSNNTYWMWPPNGIYTNDNIPDPQKYLICIFIDLDKKLNESAINNIDDSCLLDNKFSFYLFYKIDSFLI